MARQDQSVDPLYRAGEPLGERLQREFQWLRSSARSALRDELLNGEIFYTLKEAKGLIEKWRKHYNTVRAHSALGYRPPAPEALRHHRVDLISALDGLRTDQRFRKTASSLN